ncbi:MAG: RdgB/HAM1 family non-canonical purine NTP pyrophosphatase [Lachnospiraceae bacterium]|nr:RdgB/HAM1 family non-canonical purine NTP pyrophosphatase [Lachnospiraceae bacterium]
MQTIIFATGNKDKMKEIRMILGGMGAEILSMKEAGIVLDVEENGTSFEENARIKATAVAQRAKALSIDAIVMADDSGLEIDYLGGEPGIYSARYMGETTSYAVKNQNLIDRLSDVPDEQRTARFVCAIAAVLPEGEYLETRGIMEGRIGYGESGENGFGYDPIFILPKYGCTTADLDPEVKNEESHRGKALRAMREKLQQIT